MPVGDVYRKAGISQATYFNWKKKNDGLLPTEMRRPKQREDENLKLKQIVADLYWMAPPPLFAVSTQRPQQWGAFLPPTGPGQNGVAHNSIWPVL
jgi:hypothetical protein